MENTQFKDMREDLASEIQKCLLRQYIDGKQTSAEDYEEYKAGTELLKRCNIPQLWTIFYSFTSCKRHFTIRGYSVPEDHLALNVNGLYVGIEPDGYAHS